MWNGDGEDHVVALVEDPWFRERIIPFGQRERRRDRYSRSCGISREARRVRRTRKVSLENLPPNSCHSLLHSGHSETTQSDAVERQECRIVQSRLNLHDLLP